MNVIYYMSSVLMLLALIVLPIAIIYFMVKPHTLNKSKYISKPLSRPKIFLIGMLALFLSLFSFSNIMAATEPEHLKQQTSDETVDKEKAEEKKKREEEAKKPVVKTETKTEPIPFESIEEEDASLPQGQTRVVVEGVEGVRTDTYEVTYVEDKETERTIIKSEITKAPTTKVTKVGTYVAPPTPAPTPTPQANENVYYKNCSAARAAGAAPVYRGEPGYASHLDRDNDGVGCE